VTKGHGSFWEHYWPHVASGITLGVSAGLAVLAGCGRKLALGGAHAFRPDPCLVAAAGRCRRVLARPSILGAETGKGR
jgi:hypothetical protein